MYEGFTSFIARMKCSHDMSQPMRVAFFLMKASQSALGAATVASCPSIPGGGGGIAGVLEELGCIEGGGGGGGRAAGAGAGAAVGGKRK